MTGALAHAGGVSYLGTGTAFTPDGQGSTFALDDATGDVRWARPMGESVPLRASIAFQHGQPYRVIAATNTNAAIEALDPTTGEQIWSEEDSAFGQTVHGDIVYSTASSPIASAYLALASACNVADREALAFSTRMAVCKVNRPLE